MKATSTGIRPWLIWITALGLLAVGLYVFPRRDSTTAQSTQVRQETNAPAAMATANPGNAAGPTNQAVAPLIASQRGRGLGGSQSREFDLTVNPYAAGLREPGKSKRAWEVDFLERHRNASVGEPITFELTGGILASGVVKIVRHDGQGITYISGELRAPAAGKFFFLRPPLNGRAGSAVGVIEFPGNQTAYRVEPTGAGGAPELWQRRLDEVVCLSMQPVDEAALDESAEAPPLRPDLVPEYVPSYNSNIVSLQSLPGAVGVVLLDYFGGYTPTWGGVKYSAPNVSNAEIRDVWKRVAEDYMPLNINVTTDRKVFEAAPEGSRQRCVFAPDAPTAAGVAYIGSWNWGGDTVCWARYTTGKSAAEVGAHEVGHTVGLAHQGTSTEGYFGGFDGPGAPNDQTGWAPIMGVGYYQPVTTWAKGEYLDANELQDELAVMLTYNNVDYRPDDVGNTLATARYLEIFSNYTASAEGVVETAGDTDAFRFSTTGGAVALTVNPVGDWANLAVIATLVTASDVVIASNNPPNFLSASMNTTLAAGTYTLRVTGAGRNSPLMNGFSSYASLGYYSITGSVAGAVLPNRFNVAENSPTGTFVGTVGANNPGGDPLAYSLAAGNTANAFTINDSGQLTVANPAALNYEALATNSQLAVQFELFVNITNTLNAGLSELNRRVVVQVLDVNEPPVLTATTNYVLTGSPVGLAVATVAAADPDLYTVLNYSITGGNAAGLFNVGLSDGVLRFAMSPTPAQAGLYNLTVRAADTSATPTNASVTLQIIVVTNTSPLTPGGIAYAVYDGIGGGTAVSDLTGNARFPRDPDGEKLQPIFDSDRDRADSYGSVMRGYVIPPLTGNYTFFIASDDNSALLLSTTTNAATAALIASVTGSGGQTWTDRYQWTKYASQRSAPRTLVAGQAYYIEARQKDGGGGDHLSVAWAGPVTAGKTNLIEGVFLAPAQVNYVPHAGSLAATVRRDAMPGLRVGRLTITDVNTNDTTVCTILSGNSEGIFAVDNAGWVSIANGAALATTPTTGFTLPVRVTDNGVPPLSATGTVSLTLISPTNLPTQLRREIFANIAGGILANLTNNVKYPGRPDSLEVLTNFDSATSIADGYGSRVRALVVPPASGQYRFFLSSDDAGMLRLGQNATGTNLSRIAYLADGTWSDPGQWTKYSSQVSGLINLIAGQKYYLDALQKEDAGGDSVQVAWSGPGLPAGTNVLAAAYLQPVDLNYPPTVTGFTTIIPPGTPNGTLVGNIVASDSPLDGFAYQIVSGNTSNTFAIDPLNGAITVADNSQIANGILTTFHLGVLVQDSGLGGLYPLKTNYATANIGILASGVAVPGLKHRYAFTSNAVDSVGGVNAVLLGTATVAGGRLQLPGGAARVNCASLNLSGTFATNASLSFEAWCTVTTPLDWAKAWMFGQPGGENGLAYVEFTPRTGSIGVPSMSFNSAVAGELNTRTVPNPAALVAGTEYHIICAYDAPNNQMRLYVNGVQVDTGSLGGGNMTQVPASEGYLGAAVNYGDPNLIGNLNEFRVWNLPLAGLQVALNEAAGADVVLSATAATATHLTAAATNLNPSQVMQVQVNSDFNVVNLATTGYATNWASSNPSVATVDTFGLVTAVANGGATISATVAGATGTLPFWVGPVPPQLTQQPPSQSRVVGENAGFSVTATGSALAYQWNKNGLGIPGATSPTLSLSNVTFADGGDYSVTVSNSVAQITSTNAHLTVRSPQLLHRWSFDNGLDSVGGANATLVGGAGYAGGQLQVPGGAARVNCAVVNLTATLATNASLSLEGWFTLSALQDWSKVWMFGRANGGAENGLAYVDFTPRAGADGNVPGMSFNSGLSGTEQNTRGAANPAVLTTGAEYHVVCVYDADADQMRLYLNGVLADTGSLGGGNITQLNADEAYFGAPVNYGDLNLLGAINEIRIWRTPLNATLVASNFAAGPDTVVNYLPLVNLEISVVAGVPTLSWPYGVLEAAEAPAGPWMTVSGAISPYPVIPEAPQKFYRVRIN